MTTPTDLLWREKMLLRLVSDDGDDLELSAALDRIRLNFYQLWAVLEELRASDEPGALITLWRLAPSGSQGWRKALFYDAALDLLRVSVAD